ncbi:acyltransferase family protein [Actinokineospora sp. HUAS TT18]|uniref:acyltransferase family protein n=1 Tax=Actinokineospora sp. HUAS TT18 TaxID=3447451 RepID=UPI003F51DAF7
MTYADYMALRRFPALDGLRAVAALIVVAFHFGGPTWSWISGWIGVHIFFALSGYLITTLALREEDRRGRLSLRDFYIRRAFRIMPVYFVVLAIYVGTHWLRHEYTASGLAANMTKYLTFMGEYVNVAVAPFAQAWTLGVEQKFYLLWPLLAFVLCAGSFAKRLGLALTTIAVLIITLIPATYNHDSMGVQYLPIVTGALMAVILHNPRGFALLSWLTKPAVSAVGLLVFIGIHLSVEPVFLWLSNGVVSFNDTYLIIIPTYGFFAALLIPMLLGPGIGQWLLTRKPMVFIGERSYSLYLIQGVAGTVVISTVPNLQSWPYLQWPAVALFSLILADVLYRTVEQPMIGVGRRLLTWLKARSAAKAAPEVTEAKPRETAQASA